MAAVGDSGDLIPRVRAGVVPLVEVHRGALLEALHQGAFCVADPEGRTVLSAGDEDLPFVLRSAAKPVQAMVSVLLGTVDALGISEVELATASASHSGEHRHEAAALSILEKAGLGEDALLCGVHPPFMPYETALVACGEEWGAVNNNCSGKHALFLATCVHKGWDTRAYRDLDHPLQQEVRRLVCRLAGVEEGQAHAGVDGCSVPAWGLSLRSAATMFARVTDPSGLDPDTAAAARRVTTAMMEHPEMVAGRGRLCTGIMEAAPGRVWAKVGAEGFYAVGIPATESHPALGMALKIADGDPLSRARAAVTVEVLERFGVLQAKQADAVREAHAPLIVRNHRGRDVGRLHCLLPAAPKGSSLDSEL